MLRRELGRGGMGVVYEAEQLDLKRTVALKLLHAGVPLGPQQLARFRAEAEATARLCHPNVVELTQNGADVEVVVGVGRDEDGGLVEGQAVSGLTDERAEARRHTSHVAPERSSPAKSPGP